MADPQLPPLGPARLLILSKAFHEAGDIAALLAIVRDDFAQLGYRHVWVGIFEDEERQLRIHKLADSRHELSAPDGTPLRVDDDPFLNAVRQGDHVVVVEDARNDPRVGDHLLAYADNRTIISIPLRLVDARFGALGLGTLGEEGPRAPSPEVLSYLTEVGSHLAVAVARLHLAEEREKRRAERASYDRHLAQRQRLESLGLLAGGIAHDFNNLLTVILGNAGLIDAGPLQEAQRSDLRMLIDAAEQATALTRQLLAMSRKQPLRLTVIDLNERVRGVVGMLRRLLPADIAIDFIAGARLPAVEADPGQLEQVLVNLCVNARDAMPSGGTVTLETEHVVVNGAYRRLHPWAQPGRYVLISVTDTGVGMSPETLERAFEPFFTTKDPERGSGLGLSIAYGIIQQHSGMIHGYSELGMGSTFKVYLPVHSRLATDVGNKLQGPIPRGHERVLVADDQEHVRTVMRRVLEEAGYDVTVVDDGTRAVAACAATSFDLVILDAVMPQMGGREAYERIRVAHPDTCFLFSSGYGADALPASLLRDLDVRLVPKPFDPETLLRAVRDVLDA